MAAPAPAVLAGMVSTTLFVVSYLPMLVKAYRTRDLTSYSLGNLVLANVGNAIHSVYVFSLPVGPIWFLHTFYLVSTIAMLVWHRRAPIMLSHGRPALERIPMGPRVRLEVHSTSRGGPMSRHLTARTQCQRFVRVVRVSSGKTILRLGNNPSRCREFFQAPPVFLSTLDR